MALFCGSAVLRGAGRGCCYPPALWRGGSSDAAKLRSEGWGDYACSEFATRMTQLCSEQAAPPTPDPSPPLASLAGGGGQKGRAGGGEHRRCGLETLEQAAPLTPTLSPQERGEGARALCLVMPPLKSLLLSQL